MLITRQKLEENEAHVLAPYALLSGKSKGRRHHDTEPQYRTAFQRDRDRIIHSAAFRRLEYKTQVFVNDEGDYYRTRLTHTLEVAQIGRTLARGFALNEDLVEAICLAHDLGHPPFGHAGEQVLNTLTEAHGGYNHNHQSYRVVTELEQRYPQWNGLNLTFETLEGIAKHETEYDVSKLTEFDADTRASLEAQIANVVDELAYNTHDLDDALKSNTITPHQLADVEIWQVMCERLGWNGTRLDETARHHFIREMIGLEVDDVLKATSERLTKINPQSPLDAQKLDYNIVSHSDDMKRLNRQFKNFMYENMYRHPRVVMMAKRAEQFITKIFESYVDEPALLPREFQAKIDTEGLHRVVADYIASMTDRSAVLEYRRLHDPTMRP